MSVYIPPKIGKAMAKQVIRVNGNQDDLQSRYEAALQTIELLREQLRQHIGHGVQPASNSTDWLLTSDYCKAHNVTMSYLNRALNQHEGYHLSIPGKRSSTGRWMVHVNAVFSHSKKSRQKTQ